MLRREVARPIINLQHGRRAFLDVRANNVLGDLMLNNQVTPHDVDSGCLALNADFLSDWGTEYHTPRTHAPAHSSAQSTQDSDRSLAGRRLRELARDVWVA